MAEDMEAVVARLSRWAMGATTVEVWGRQSRPVHIGTKRADLRALLSERQKMVEALTEARDLLLERKHGNPARSPGHNARLVIEAALSGSADSGR